MPLPDFFIVGAAKSGTTSLYNYLKSHPQVHMSPIKEPQHFGSDIGGRGFGEFDGSAYFARDPLPEMHIANVERPEDYRRLFEAGPQKKVAGEASTSYLYSRKAAREIRRSVPGARIIIILRDPVQRAYSHYLMNQKSGYARHGFIEEVERDMAKSEKGWGVSDLYVEIGQYYEQVKRYLEEFPRNQVRIMLFEDFIGDPAATMGGICRFLGVDAGLGASHYRAHLSSGSPRFGNAAYFLNRIGARKIKDRLPDSLSRSVEKLIYRDKKPEMTPEERDFMRKFFRADVDKLSRLTGLHVSRWNYK